MTPVEVDDAMIHVHNTPAIIKPGQSATVLAILRNTGTRPWSAEGLPVRLLIRWFDAATGMRARWEIKWLNQVVPPGGTAQLKFDIEFPSRPGRYRLSYALVRLSGEHYEEPAPTTIAGRAGRSTRVTPRSQSLIQKLGRYSEFGEISYRVIVE